MSALSSSARGSAGTGPGVTRDGGAGGRSDAVGHAGLVRAGLVALAAVPAVIGVWALAAPKGFHAAFPGTGTGWVAALGPYDEHLVRDVGALNLALAVLLLLAAIRMTRSLVEAALVVAFVAGLPHAIYHLTETGRLPLADDVVSNAGLVLVVVLPLALLWAARRPARPAEEQGTP